MSYNPLEITISVISESEPDSKNRNIIICLNQICYIDEIPIEGGNRPSEAKLYMSNGKELHCVDPPYFMWKNDCFVVNT